MTNAIATFFGGKVATPTNTDAIRKSLEGLAANKAAMTSGRGLLKLSKSTGTWVFGMENDPLEDNTILVVNPASVASGYVAWNAGQIEGEVMNPVHAGPVDYNALPPVRAKNGWQTQVSVDLSTMDAVPLQLSYKTNSYGGIKAVLALAGEIAVGLSEDLARAFPMIKLSSTSYIHKEYGKVYNPIIEIVGWLGADGEPVAKRTSLI